MVASSLAPSVIEVLCEDQLLVVVVVVVVVIMELFEESCSLETAQQERKWREKEK